LIAIQKLKEKANKIAAHMLQADAARLAFEGGRYRFQQPKQQRQPKVPNRCCRLVRLRLRLYLNRSSMAKSGVSIQDVALAAHCQDLPPDTEPGLSATYFLNQKIFTFPFSVRTICVVEIDRDTGDVNVLALRCV